jgi:hypothetical protein
VNSLYALLYLSAGSTANARRVVLPMTAMVESTGKARYGPQRLRSKFFLCAGEKSGPTAELRRADEKAAWERPSFTIYPPA